MTASWAFTKKADVKRLLFVVTLLLLASPVFAAPFLAWDAVTTDADGNLLGAGLEVTEYRIYRCGTSLGGPCIAPDRLLAGTATAPATQFDLAGQPIPQVYVVTAVNKVGESIDSLKFKVVPPAVPKNLRLP